MTWTSNPPLDPKLFITGEQLGQLYQSFIKDYPGEHWDETERAPGGTLMELGGTGKQGSDTEKDCEALHGIGMNWNGLGG